MRKREEMSHVRDFHLGFRGGGLFLLGCWVIWDCVVDSQLRPTTASGDSSKNFWLDRAIPVYRCCGVFFTSNVELGSKFIGLVSCTRQLYVYV